MMRQHSKVVHASSGGVDLRAAKVQERMASSISVDWSAKRAPQNPPVFPLITKLTIAESSSTTWNAKTIEGIAEDKYSYCATTTG